LERRTSILGNIDWLTVFLYGILVFFGWISIYSNSPDEATTRLFDLSVKHGKQLLWIAMAVFLAIVILIIDAKFFSTFAFWLYLLTLGVLIAVLLFGKTVAGSRSWFQVGNFAIQPAEFAKFTTALALASYLSKLNIDMRSLKTKIVAITIILLPALLIFMQNDTGSALVYFSFVIVLYREGLSGAIFIIGLIMAVLFVTTLLFSKLYVLAALALLLLLGLVLFRRFRKNWRLTLSVFTLAAAFVMSVNYAFEHVLEPHQKTRINVLMGIEKDPRGAGYNVNQSLIAIGSGGLTGKGFRKGMLTQYQFVPEQSTDFIFCTVGEEWGFAGVLVVVLLFATLIVRIIILAERQRSKFSRIYGYGVASILFFHFAINIGMTIGLFPVMGIPLPFFSYGGSSLWAFTILLFIFIKQDANRLNVL